MKKIFNLFKKLFTEKNILKIIAIFISSRLIIFLMPYFSYLIAIKNETNTNPISFIDLFFRWDSVWYINIVENGYFFTLEKYSNVVFFPMYPLIVKMFSNILGNPKLIGFIISNIALLLACIYLYKLLRMDYGKKLSLQSIFFLLITPVSFFFSIFYTEGLFLLLSIACFYYARKKRWLISSMLGFFLSLTKLIGVVILIPILIEYLEISFKPLKINYQNIKKNILFLILIPVGLLTYMSCLFIKFGDPLAFYHASATAWGRKLVPIFQTFKSINVHGIFLNSFFIISILIAMILIAFLILKKVRTSYVIYTFVLFFIYLSSNLLESTPRYIGVLFPIYLSLALLVKKYKFLDIFLKTSSIILLILLTTLFTVGYCIT